ncbi:MAG: S-layer homology domain-containing protein [Bacillota bacterium]
MKRRGILKFLSYIMISALLFGFSPQYCWGLTIDPNLPVLQLIPSAPSALTAKLDSNVTVKLTWTDNSTNETGFVLQRRVLGGIYENDLVTLPAGTTSYTDQLNNNFGMFGTVYYQVRAINSMGSSGYSNEASVEMDQPNAPTGLSVTYGINEAVNLVWNSTSPELTDYFKILRKVENGSYETIGTTDESHYTDSTVSPGNTYYYRVEVIGYLGGSMSDAQGVVVPEEAVTPTIPTTTTDSEADGSIDFSSASDWAESEIQEAYDLQLTTDTILNNFNRDITRIEFCEIAVRLYEALSGKKALPAIVNPFADTTNTMALKAFELGIIKGTSDTTFSPNNPITRQEICVMIYRTLKADNPSLNMDISGVSAFSDESSIALWAIDAVKFANKNSIMNGMGNNKINPLGNTSREQAIVLMKRTFQNFN